MIPIHAAAALARSFEKQADEARKAGKETNDTMSAHIANLAADAIEACAKDLRRLIEQYA